MDAPVTLTEEEVTLVNRAKALDAQAQGLVLDVREHLRAMWMTARADLRGELEVAARMGKAEPERWLAAGRADIQVGVMKIVRSIVQPES